MRNSKRKTCFQFVPLKNVFVCIFSFAAGSAKLKYAQVCECVCMPVSMQVCKFPSIIYVSMQVFKYVTMPVCENLCGTSYWFC